MEWSRECASGSTSTLNSANKYLYLGIFKVLNLYACMPVSTATAEHSFSTMRRVKTYLRNTMTTKQMSGLGLLNIYREKETSQERVLDIFSRKEKRNGHCFFKTELLLCGLFYEAIFFCLT